MSMLRLFCMGTNLLYKRMHVSDSTLFQTNHFNITWHSVAGYHVGSVPLCHHIFTRGVLAGVNLTPSFPLSSIMPLSMVKSLLTDKFK